VASYDRLGIVYEDLLGKPRSDPTTHEVVSAAQTRRSALGIMSIRSHQVNQLLLQESPTYPLYVRPKVTGDAACCYLHQAALLDQGAHLIGVAKKMPVALWMGKDTANAFALEAIDKLSERKELIVRKFH
jgi:hypothetical protein